MMMTMMMMMTMVKVMMRRVVVVMVWEMMTVRHVGLKFKPSFVVSFT